MRGGMGTRRTMRQIYGMGSCMRIRPGPAWHLHGLCNTHRLKSTTHICTTALTHRPLLMPCTHRVDAGKVELDGASYFGFGLPFSLTQLIWIEVLAVGGAEFYRNSELNPEKRLYPGEWFRDCRRH